MSAAAKLFLTTFLVIFLAELGDKTQLAVMARAASASARWTVFLAASLALVTSTLVAVLLGRQLTRIVPDAYLRVGAAVVFILFGLLMLAEALRSPRQKTPSAVHEGPLTRLVLAWAADFEQSVFDDYSKLADKSVDPELKALFHRLALEEKGHFHRILNLKEAHQHAHLKSMEARPETIPERGDLFLKLPRGSHDDRILARKTAGHERVTASFYHELSRMTILPGLSRAFEWLAEAESEHAERIERWIQKQEPDDRVG